MGMPKKKISDEECQRMLYQYEIGCTAEDIASAFGRNKSVVYKCIRKAKELNGETTQQKIEKIDLNSIRGCVNCNPYVSNHCIYGSVKSTGGCNYIIVTSHMRGCSPRECNKFENGNPKYYDKR